MVFPNAAIGLHGPLTRTFLLSLRNNTLAKLFFSGRHAAQRIERFIRPRGFLKDGLGTDHRLG